MAGPRLDARVGGIATAVGYVLVFVLLFRHPIRALDAVNADFPGTVYFVVFPVTGTLAGLYAARGGPGSGALLIVAGPVLAGVAVLRPIGPVEAELPVTVALALIFCCGAVATSAGVASVWSWASGRLDRA